VVPLEPPLDATFSVGQIDGVPLASARLGQHDEGRQFRVVFGAVAGEDVVLGCDGAEEVGDRRAAR